MNSTYPRSTSPSWLTRLLTLLTGALLVLLSLVGTASAAQAAPSTDPTPPAGAVEQCLGAGKVWLVVVTETGQTLANQCVDTPATGIDALNTAGLAITRSTDGFICTIGGHPEVCPAAFTGSYWQYYTGTPGSDWEYYQVGPDQSQPKAGTIEGWCYGDVCTPPELGGVTIAPAGTATPTTAESTPATTGSPTAATSSPAATPGVQTSAPAAGDEGGSGTVIWVIAGLAALIVIAGGVLLARRARRPHEQEAAPGRLPDQPRES